MCRASDIPQEEQSVFRPHLLLEAYV